jgi:outer membrane phospholipase A
MLAWSSFILASTAMTIPAERSPLEILVVRAATEDHPDRIVVDLRILNDGEAPITYLPPDHVEAKAVKDGAVQSLDLIHETDGPDAVTIPPHGFIKATYHTDGPRDVDVATISVPAFRSAEIKLVARETREPFARPILSRRDATKVPNLATPPELAPGDRLAGNAFARNLAPYEPIYAVYGPGTDTSARIQISFKYRLFGSRESQGLGPSWRDGLHIAYTQRMFWDVSAKSSPFRNIDYLPELFYLAKPLPLNDGLVVSGQLGFRHESNGRAGEESRSMNSAYIAPMAAAALDGGYRLTIGPRLSFRIGDKSDNPDIVRYRGATSLFMEVGREDGLRLSTSTRLNFSSGKGAFSADLSYPLTNLWSGGPDLYLFGQSFVGYGENLLDYDRNVTRLRVGFALVR